VKASLLQWVGSACLALMTVMGGYVDSQFGDLTESVASLNVKIAVVIEKVEAHDSDIRDNGDKIRTLERQQWIRDAIKPSHKPKP